MVSRDSQRGSAKKDTCQLENTILESSRTYRMVKHCGAPLKQAVHTFISRDRSSFIKFMATVNFIRMPNAPSQKWQKLLFYPVSKQTRCQQEFGSIIVGQNLYFNQVELV